MSEGNVNSEVKSKDRNFKEFASKNAIYLVLLALLVGIGAMDSSFLSYVNLRNVLIIASVRIIIALGVGGALITRGTDLSAGRVVGLTACIAASLLQRPDYAYKLFKDLPSLPVAIPILAAILVGLAIGCINGVVVAYLKVPPFIATLGMMVIVYGLACIYTNAQPIGGLRNDFTSIASGEVGIIPNLIIIAAIVAFIIWFIYNKTRFGKYIYAIGGNPSAAEVSGVNVEFS